MRGTQSARLVRRRMLGVAVAATILFGGAASGCGGKTDVIGPGVAILRVSERDFKITAPKEIRAGDVELVARNRGPGDHELIVVRERGSRLPFRSDGITIDEEALEPAQAGAIEPFSGGEKLQIHLSPGRYVLFCNMAGHYLGGMHTTLVVR